MYPIRSLAVGQTELSCVRQREYMLEPLDFGNGLLDIHGVNLLYVSSPEVVLGSQMAVFCLVHGSTQDASGWALLVSELRNRGHEGVCANLPVNEPDAPLSGTPK